MDNSCKDQHNFKEIQNEITGETSRTICKECNSEKITLDNGSTVTIAYLKETNYDATKFYER
jgi:Zn finger protein HypA/HybF involved in hydrogenase expression